MSSRPLRWRVIAPSPSVRAPRLALIDPATDDDRASGEPRTEERQRHVRVVLGGAERPASAARRVVDDHCAGRVPPDLVDDLRIIVSELVANVLQHGGGADGLTIEVTIRAHEVDVEVIGRGDRRTLPPARDWRLPPSPQPSGRGLAIVRRLAAWVAIDGDDPVPDRNGWIGITASVPLTGAERSGTVSPAR